LVARVAAFRLGNGMEPNTTHGPLINGAAVRKVSKHVQNAVQHGAAVLTGGRAAPWLGEAFYEPTVLGNVSPESLCAKEETFGPLVPLIRFEQEERVVSLANNVKSGLAGYIFTSDLSRAWRVAEALELGMVGVNTGLISDVSSPFGGVKESGQGREGSYLGIDEYLETKSITFEIGS